jgi:uncharacterized circularly permuted ATP-grasp superfamily protein
VPRIIPKREWDRTEAGLKQRVQALNLFIDDLYHDQKIIKDGVFPAEVLAQSVNFRPQCVGVNPATASGRTSVAAIWCATAMARSTCWKTTCACLRRVLHAGEPGGHQAGVAGAVRAPAHPAGGRLSSRLYDMLASLSPRPGDQPTVVVLTPGIYNSAYFEHAYLAQQHGRGTGGRQRSGGRRRRLRLHAHHRGLERVDVIYRRIDDVPGPRSVPPRFRAGRAGLMRAWRKGNVALANAPGAGVADDKVVYAFVPDIIRYYLDQDPLIPNVPSYLCMREQDRKHVLANLDKLVVKPANESGGYGMLIGPHATPAEHRRFAKLIQDKIPATTWPSRCWRCPPRRRCATTKWSPACGFAAVHPVRSRTYVTTGGLTRVALRKGSLVVNSSQGGGSKDTWIVDTEGF